MLARDGDAVTTGRSAERSLKFRRVPWRVLVLGGARSGKSEQAELRVAGEPDVTYVATGAAPEAGDAEWARRVAAHRGRRPAWWRTAETTDLAGVLASARGALLIDGIGTWLAAAMDECGAWDGSAHSAARLAARIAGLTAAWRQTGAHVVAVSDEAGLGVVPATPAGRLFRDELGRLNQVLAAESEEAELVVAGRVMPLLHRCDTATDARARKRAGSRPNDNGPVTIRRSPRIRRSPEGDVCPLAGQQRPLAATVGSPAAGQAPVAPRHRRRAVCGGCPGVLGGRSPQARGFRGRPRASTAR
jgi:adenosyl cobinamide kinase/adenosyl cobinamide phosphate guanylyltransferase